MTHYRRTFVYLSLRFGVLLLVGLLRAGASFAGETGTVPLQLGETTTVADATRQLLRFRRENAGALLSLLKDESIPVPVKNAIVAEAIGRYLYDGISSRDFFAIDGMPNVFGDDDIFFAGDFQNLPFVIKRGSQTPVMLKPKYAANGEFAVFLLIDELIPPSKLNDVVRSSKARIVAIRIE